jgi:gentisate 1,2-dioxygenase
MPAPIAGTQALIFVFDKLKALEAHISELPPGGATKIHRHMCEALFYVLKGRGHSIMQAEGQLEKQVEWHAGDLFFTPMFVWHRHVNVDLIEPVRYLEITTLPLMKAIGVWSIETAEEDANNQRVDNE